MTTCSGFDVILPYDPLVINPYDHCMINYVNESWCPIYGEPIYSYQNELIGSVGSCIIGYQDIEFVQGLDSVAPMFVESVSVVKTWMGCPIGLTYASITMEIMDVKIKYVSTITIGEMADTCLIQT